MDRNIIDGLYSYWNSATSGKYFKKIAFLAATILFVPVSCTMSRCFPFPPPGYERKQKPEYLDVVRVREVKHKEKRHKKDKERRKDKDKKEKDGSYEKHRDKKDRKGKQEGKKKKCRDHKIDKENQGKDKGKNIISEDLTVLQKLEERNHCPKDLRRDRSIVVDEGQCSTLFQCQNGGRTFENSMPSSGTKGSKVVQELERRIRNDEAASGNQLPERVAGLIKRDQEIEASAVKYAGVLAEEKDYSKGKRVDGRDVRGLRTDVGGNVMVQNLITAGKSKVAGILGQWMNSMAGGTVEKSIKKLMISNKETNIKIEKRKAMRRRRRRKVKKKI